MLGRMIAHPVWFDLIRSKPSDLRASIQSSLPAWLTDHKSADQTCRVAIHHSVPTIQTAITTWISRQFIITSLLDVWWSIESCWRFDVHACYSARKHADSGSQGLGRFCSTIISVSGIH